MRADATKATGTLSKAEGSATLAIGSYSHAEGSNTQATDTATHAEGQFSVAGAPYAHAEGDSTQATGQSSHAEGAGTLALGIAAHAEGNSSRVDGNYGHARGEYASAPRRAQSSQAAGRFAAAGDAQTIGLIARLSTTDATPGVLVGDGTGSPTVAGGNINVLTIALNRAHQFRVSVVARRSDVSGDTAGWVFTGLVARGSSGNAAIVGTTLGNSWGAAGAAAWDAAVSVDTTDQYLKVTVTGEAAKTIRWVATITTTEVG